MSAVQERFRLSELAARAAKVERVVPAAEFERFAALCRCVTPLRIRLQFGFDEEDRIRVQGEVSARLVVQCHRCLAPVETALAAAFAGAVVGSDEEASRLGASRSVLLLEGDAADLAQLVEDELILALPERPCADQGCPKAPAAAFPEAAPRKAEKPFRELAALMAANGNK